MTTEHNKTQDEPDPGTVKKIDNVWERIEWLRTDVEIDDFNVSS